MNLIFLLVLLVAVGIILALVPMDAGIKRILVIVVSVVVTVVLIVWLLQITGVGSGPSLRLGR